MTRRVDDPTLRQAYLEAMGVQAWARRDAAVERVAAPVSEAAGAGSLAPDVTSVPTPPSPTPAPMDPSGIGALDLGGLARVVADCQACALAAGRTHTVFGVGDPSARLMIVGEGPGAEEDRQGEPFVGRAGRLLNAMLRAMGLDREAVYIANIVKCRPPNNRDPRPEEVAACSRFLRRQIELVRPGIIVAVGRVAAQNLLGSTETLGRMRGREHVHAATGTPVVVTYHPAYLLRTPADKWKAWEDLRRVMRLLERDR